MSRFQSPLHLALKPLIKVGQFLLSAMWAPAQDLQDCSIPALWSLELCLVPWPALPISHWSTSTQQLFPVAAGSSVWCLLTLLQGNNDFSSPHFESKSRGASDGAWKSQCGSIFCLVLSAQGNLIWMHHGNTNPLGWRSKLSAVGLDNTYIFSTIGPQTTIKSLFDGWWMLHIFVLIRTRL